MTVRDLFEVGHRKQLLDPGQKIAHEGLEGGVKVLVEDLLMWEMKQVHVSALHSLQEYVWYER